MSGETILSYRFGDYLLSPREHLLTCDGQEIPLRPKSFEVLVHLVRNHNHVVSRDELLAAVWPETHITETVLSHSIWEIRQIFDEKGEETEPIRTVPKVGYQFTAEVVEIPVEPDCSTGPLRQPETERQVGGIRLFKLLAGAGGFAVVLVVLALFIWWSPSASPEEPIDSIAVLPFVNVGGDPECEYLSEGIPRSLSSSLSKIADLRVIPSSSLQRYRGQQPDARNVANELNVRSFLTGTVIQRGEILVISVEFIDAVTNRLLWGEQYTRQFADIFELQEEIAAGLGKAVRPNLTGREERELTQRNTDNPNAYEAFLKGRYHGEHSASGDVHESLKKAIGYYKRAIELDSDFAQAYAEMAGCYFLIASTVSGAEEDYRKSRETIEQAIEIDPGLPLAHLSKAWILWSWEKDWAGAESEYRRASDDLGIFLRPTNYLNWLGRRSEALEVVENLAELSDPLSTARLISAGWALFNSREFERAVTMGKSALELEPDAAAAHWLLLYAYDAQARSNEAFEAFRAGGQVTGEWSEEYEEAYRNSGMDGVWRVSIEVQNERGNLRAGDMALRHARIGDKEQAFEWLRKATKKPLLSPIATHPHMDPLRDDPRFEQFLRKLNLPEDAIERHLALARETP